MIFLRMTVVVRPGVVGRPEKDDLTFYWPDGTVYDGPTISPSAYSKFASCEQKWGLYAIKKVPQKEKPSTKTGLEAHGYLEDWLERRQPPPATALGLRMASSGVLEHFPPPQSKGLAVEEVFAFAFAPNDEDHPVVFWGFKDAEQWEWVFDLKTTGDIRWAKTRAELLEDPQANVYAADNLLQTGELAAHCRWVYVTTKGKAHSEPREATFPYAHVVRKLSSYYEQALAMTLYRMSEDVDVDQMPRNWSHCSEFGGCDYIDLCKQHRTAGSGLQAKRQQARLAEQRAQQQEHDDMGALEDIKAKIQAGGRAVPGVGPKVPVNKPAGPPAKAAPAPAKAAPAPAKAAPAPARPTTGRLASAVQAVGTGKSVARPATGIRPPDAPPATVDGDPEEGLEAEAGEQEEEEQEEQEAAPPPPPPKKAPAKAPHAPAKAAPAKKPAPPPPPEEPAAGPVEVVADYVLLIDARAVKGAEVVPFEGSGLLDQAVAELEAEAQMPYRLIEFGRGPAMLAATVEPKLNGLSGFVSVSTQLVDREVVALLVRHATLVIQG